MVGPCHTRRCVAWDRLYENMVLFYTGQLFSQEVEILHRGTDINVLRRDDLRHTIPRLLHLRTACAKEIYKLFWTTLTAAGPQALASSACKNETIVLVNVCVNEFHIV